MVDTHKLTVHMSLLKDAVSSKKNTKNIIDALSVELKSRVNPKNPKLSKEYLDVVQGAMDTFVEKCSMTEHDNFVRSGGDKFLKLLKAEQDTVSGTLLQNLNDVLPVDLEAELLNFGGESEMPKELLVSDEELGEVSPSQFTRNPITDAEQIQPVKREKIANKKEVKKTTSFVEILSLLGLDEYQGEELEFFAHQTLPLITDDLLLSKDSEYETLIQLLTAYNDLEKNDQNNVKNRLRSMLKSYIEGEVSEEKNILLKIKEVFDVIGSTDNPIKKALKEREQAENDILTLEKIRRCKEQQATVQSINMTFDRVKESVSAQVVACKKKIETYKKDIPVRGISAFLVNVTSEIIPFFSSLSHVFQDFFVAFEKSEIKLSTFEKLTHIKNTDGSVVSIEDFLRKEQAQALVDPMKFPRSLDDFGSPMFKNIDKVQRSIAFKLQTTQEDNASFLQKNTEFVKDFFVKKETDILIFLKEHKSLIDLFRQEKMFQDFLEKNAYLKDFIVAYDQERADIKSKALIQKKIQAKINEIGY